MNAIQLRLLPDARPLVDRLGPAFFRSIPENPGVYLLRGADDAILYVGKALNLRQRLRSYRVANPESMPRRRLRLLHLARRIEWRITGCESSALALERELLRDLKPRFNRAGIWPAPARFLLWRVAGDALELTLSGEAADGWSARGPLGAGSRACRAAAVRLVWCGWFARRGLQSLPAGWFHGRFPECVHLSPDAETLPSAATIASLLDRLNSGEPAPFQAWVSSAPGVVADPLIRSSVASDLEWLVPGSSSPPGEDSAESDRPGAGIL